MPTFESDGSLDPGSVALIGRDPQSIFRAALDEAPHGSIVSTEDGEILFTNHLADRIFGYLPFELIGQPISCLISESQRSLHAGFWVNFWKDSRSRRMSPKRTVTGVRKDGVLVALEVGLNVIVEGASRYVVAAIVDITDRVNLEALLAAASHEQLGFQRLVADIAARFGRVEPDGVDEAIVDSLRQIGEALSLDRSILWKKPAGEAITVPTHYWVPPGAGAPEPFPVASVPFVISKLEAGEACWFTSPEDLPDPIDRETFLRRGPQSAAVVPLTLNPQEPGELIALTLGATNGHEWTPMVIERLRLVAGVIAQALVRTANDVALNKALEEIRQLRDQLATENVELRREVKVLRKPSEIISESPAIKRILRQVEQVAPTPATVLLLGDTGTGKEVIARAIHDLSPRHHRQMVRVSCAAIPAALIESELFGRERGAYTGALSRQIGRFEAANQSTLFLDEIGELSMEVQVKLLRVLQERVIERLGSTQSIKVDVRIIAATNRNLEEAVTDKSFREDLYYRLNVFPIVVPPLRDRVEDIPGLVWAFVDEFARSFGKTIDSISKDSLRELERYTWPGNVRELRNVVERAVILTNSRQLVVPPPRPAVKTIPKLAMTLEALEGEHIRQVLESTGGRVRGAGGAAERLGLKPTTLESRMARLGIQRKKS